MSPKKKIKISNIEDSKIDIVGGTRVPNVGTKSPVANSREERSRMLGDTTTDAPPPDVKKKKPKMR